MTNCEYPVHVEIPEYDALLTVGSPGFDGGQICSVYFCDTQECREQMVYGINLHRSFEATVLRRASKMDRDKLTPQTLLPLKSQPTPKQPSRF